MNVRCTRCEETWLSEVWRSRPHSCWERPSAAVPSHVVSCKSWARRATHVLRSMAASLLHVQPSRTLVTQRAARSSRIAHSGFDVRARTCAASRSALQVQATAGPSSPHSSDTQVLRRCASALAGLAASLALSTEVALATAWSGDQQLQAAVLALAQTTGGAAWACAASHACQSSEASLLLCGRRRQQAVCRRAQAGGCPLGRAVPGAPSLNMAGGLCAATC